MNDSIFKYPSYLKAPKKDGVKRLIDNFRSHNGDHKFKVGVVSETRLKIRYLKDDIFEQLEMKNILCTCTFQTAKEMEALVKDSLVADGKCDNFSKMPLGVT